MRGANIRGFSVNEKANYSIFLLLNASKTNILKNSDFQKGLLKWYSRHKRDLPWRKTSDPYKIWLSEIILQQTRVNQGLPYYLKFIRNYPNVQELADAQEDSLMKDWEGLGYYSRARNLHSAAKYIVNDLDGVFPGKYDDILKMKGVGTYTAAAIASFAFNEAHAVLDGNVFRVLSRYYAVDTPINSTNGKKEFTELANKSLLQSDPATYNQAIMEFGALQCTPKSPDCENCPVQSSCEGYRLGMVHNLPMKIKKTYNRERFFNYFLIKKDNNILVEQRQTKDIWNKLYQFPLIEKEELLSYNEASLILEEEFSLDLKSLRLIESHKLKAHKLSHQTIHCQIFVLEANAHLNFSKAIWCKEEDLEQFAFPRPLRIFLDRKQLNLPFD